MPDNTRNVAFTEANVAAFCNENKFMASKKFWKYFNNSKWPSRFS